VLSQSLIDKSKVMVTKLAHLIIIFTYSNYGDPDEPLARGTLVYYVLSS